MDRVTTACPLDCPDLCTLDVDVEQGRVVQIEGSRLNPLTDGVICGKVRKFPAHMYGPERLHYPMIRDGARNTGAFRRASWDEALDLIASRTRAIVSEHGGEAVLPYNYGGSNGFLTQNSVDARLFRRLGASRSLRTLCGAPAAAAVTGLYGGLPGVALEDYVHARLIVLWSINPSATGIHLVPIINEARRRGAKLVVLDPRRIPLARGADLHIPLRPGSDLPVALSVIHWLFERGAHDEAFLAEHATGTDALRERAARWPVARAAEIAGVPADAIERFAALYAESTPAVIRCGWGMERSRNGGSAVASVLALPAVAGKFGVRGGGFTQSTGAAWRVSVEPAVCEPEPETRAINMNQLGHALLRRDDPPIKLLFVYNCNPVPNTPNQAEVCRGLMREDLFTVVFDQVHTDTANYADVILPATTFLEHRDLRRGYGAMHIVASRPVAAPVGESRANYDVFAELCQRLDLARPGDPVTADELTSAILDASPDGDELRTSLAERGIAERPGGARPVLFVDAFPTTGSGKIELVPEHLDAEAPGGLYSYTDDPGTERYPLALISPALSTTISSTFGQLIAKQVPVAIHPDDAAKRGIRDGDAVRVFNELGEIRCAARLSADLRPGVAFMPKGIWRRHTSNGATASAVAPDRLSDLAGGACYNDARVDIAPA